MPIHAVQSIAHPSAWTGRDLIEAPEWQHALGADETQELQALLGGIDESPSEVRVDGRPYETLGATDLPLPRLADRLHRMQHDLEHGTGAVRLRRGSSDLTEAQGRVLLWALSVHLGTPVSQSAAGDRIFSVRDAGTPDGDARVRGPNTNRTLSFHTDRADVTGFLCLRAAREGGDNQVVSSMAVYNEVARRRPDLLRELQAPFYYLRHTVDLGNDQAWCQQPVFSFADGHFACCFLRVLIERAHRTPELADLTPAQIEARDLVESIAEEPGMAVTFRQEPGDLVFIDNRVLRTVA